MTQNTTNQTNPGAVAAAVLALVGGLVILYFIATFAIQAASFLASSLSRWGANVDAEVMAVIVAAILAFALTQLNATRQSRNQFTNQTNQKKLGIYRNAVHHVSKSPITPDISQLDAKQDESNTNSLAADIITCGNNNVIKAFKAWRIAKEQQDRDAAILAAGNLLLAIRKDLNLNNRGISNKDLMKCTMKIKNDLSRDAPHPKTTKAP